MSIEELVDPSVSLISAALQRAQVREVMEEAHRALADLRFAEGLRRGWEEARAESAVREATALALLEGVRTHVNDVRQASMRGTGVDPGELLALGIWRAQWNMASRFEPLNVPSGMVQHASRPVALPALIASIHRDICSGLVGENLMEARGVAFPSDGAALARGLEYVRSDLPALAVGAALTAHFRVRKVFDVASASVGASVGRWVLVTRGVDPSGVSVPSAYDATDVARASRSLAGWVMANEEGVARWLIHYCQGVIFGAQVGRDVALRVQAGRLE